jgi:hypothetical protein
MPGVDAATGVQFGGNFTDNLITNMHLDFIAEAMNNSTVWWSMLNKKSVTPIAGRFITFPIRFGRNTGINAIRPGGKLPDPGNQGSKTASFETRSIFGRIKIDGETLRRADTALGGAYIDPVLYEMDGQADDMAIYQNRCAHNDGSGRLAEYASGTTTITLRLNQDIEGAASVTGNFMGEKYFDIGDRITLINPTTGLSRIMGAANDAYFVIARTATTIQVSATPTGSATAIAAATAGDWFVRASQGTDFTPLPTTSTALRCEPMGLGGIASDVGVLDGNGVSAAQQQGSSDNTFAIIAASAAGFQGLLTTTASGNTFNRAVVLDNGGAGARPLTKALLQQTVSDFEEQNNGVGKIWLSDYTQYNRMVALLDPDKRYNDTLTLKGGQTAVSFNDIPWTKDRFCYPGRVYLANTDEFTVYETEPLRPLAPLGLNQWERVANDTDAYYCGVVVSYNLGVNVRQRAVAVLSELS